MLALTSGAGPAARLHPLHTTLTVVTVARDGRVEISLRAFVDDYTAAVRARARDTSAGGLVDYARSGLAVMDGRRRPVPVHGCGARVEGDLVWLCLRGSIPPRARLLVRNTLLFERFRDQVNIVQLVRDGRRSSVLFLPGDDIKPLDH